MSNKSGFHVEYRKVTIHTTDGSILYGKVNLGKNQRVSDLFNSEIPFIVMVDVLFQDNAGKTLFVNKNHIVWVEPEE